METSKRQDAPIQRQADLIAKELKLKKATTWAYLFGAIVGLLVIRAGYRHRV